MRKPREILVPVSTRLPFEVYEAVQKRRSKEGRTMQAVLERAIRAYLETPVER